MTRTNFQVVADGLTTSFLYEPGGTTLRLDDRHPAAPRVLYHCRVHQPARRGCVGSGRGPDPGHADHRFDWDEPASVAFAGALDFRNLGFEVPGLTNLAAEVCSARLVFPTNGLPFLTNLNATLQLPIPGRTNRINYSPARPSGSTGIPPGPSPCGRT